jgi:hypothetical protein
MQLFSEVSGGMLGLWAKKKPLESIIYPKVLLADANKGRKIEFLKKFITILFQKYGFILSDK